MTAGGCFSGRQRGVSGSRGKSRASRGVAGEGQGGALRKGKERGSGEREREKLRWARGVGRDFEAK